MRIAMVGFHSCIRAHKQAYDLIEKGNTVHLVGHMLSSCHSWNRYATVHLFDPNGPNGLATEQLANAVMLLSKHVDVFHVHNEPNWIFKITKQHTDKPVIWDIHDWTSERKVCAPPEEEVEEEKWALENADAFVVPSRGYQQKLTQISKKPCVLVYSMVPGFLFPTKQADLPGATFEGGVKGRNDLEYNYEYRNWASWAKRAVGSFVNGSRFYFYTANTGEDFGDYLDEKISITPPLVYPDLLGAMSQHTAGIVGSPFPVGEFDSAMPNKLFEYVASGIPCIVVNAKEAQKYVEDNGLGIGIQDPSEVGEALERLKDHKISRDRWGFTMESQTPKLLELYREVACPKRRVIRQLGVPDVPTTHRI